MLRIFLISICLLLSACDRSAQPSALEIATCIQKNKTADEKRELGLTADIEAKGRPVAIRRLAYLGCRGAKGLVDDNATRAGQGAQLTRLLENDKNFRFGVEMAAWRNAGKTLEVAQVLTFLAVQAGENTVLRAWGESCKYVGEDTNSVLRSLEAPYLAAYVGTRGFVKNATDAQGLAGVLAEQGKGHSLMEADLAATDCHNPALRSRLNTHLEEMRAFSEGSNKTVPGCKPTPDGDEYVLTCQAS